VQHRHVAEVAYQQRLLDACIGKAEFPKGQTPGKTDTTTDSMFHDIPAAAAEQTYGVTLTS